MPTDGDNCWWLYWRRKKQPGEKDACPADQAAASEGEVPVKRFAIGKFEVTVAEWNACVSAEGNYCTEREEQADEERPVTKVSLEDAKGYVNWLNSTQREQKEYQYRLPTPSEWEYAARGTKDEKDDRSCYHWGNEMRLIPLSQDDLNMVSCEG